MRRSLVLLAAVAMLVGLIAAPAGAERKRGVGYFPHEQEMLFFGALWGEPETAEIPTGEWIYLHAGWGTQNVEQLQQWMETVIVEVELDGVSQDFGTLILIDEPDYPPAVVSYYVVLPPQKAHSRMSVLLRHTLTAPHFDGKTGIALPLPKSRVSCRFQDLPREVRSPEKLPFGRCEHQTEIVPEAPQVLAKELSLVRPMVTVRLEAGVLS